MGEMAWLDREREEYGALTRVDESEDGYSLMAGSIGLGLAKSWGVVPRVGDRLTVWGVFGRPIRGIAINNVVAFYRTPAEQEAENERQLDAMKAERITAYESKRSEYDRRVAALPEPLRDRVARFREHGGDAWRWEFEPYELSVCEEAARLAAAIPDPAELDTFRRLPWDQQKRRVPNLDEGHSGNSFGAAVMLARLLLESPHLLAKAHGALCPLVGCKDYGCYAARRSGGVSRG